MPTTMLNSQNLTASAKTVNLLSGDINEFVSVDSIINIFSVSSAIGVRLSVFADSDIAIDDKEIVNIGTTILNDHLIDSFAVAGGTRLNLTLRETTAVATTDVLTKVEVTPLI